MIDFLGKDPGVPSILPFKNDFLKHVQETKTKVCVDINYL